MVKVEKPAWEIWMQGKSKAEKSFKLYLKRKTIKKEPERGYLSKSHMDKADNNIDFINHLLKEKRFYDWTIVGCYYAIYHSSLSLLSIKGYSSKSHLATLCALIYLYYSYDDEKPNEKTRILNKQDINLIIKSSIEKQEVSYFVEAKNKRESASYGIEKHNQEQAKELKEKTISFVNKTKEILENN